MESLLTNGNTTLYPKSYATHRCSPSRAAFLTGIYPFRYGLGSLQFLHLYDFQAFVLL